mmetsp:Transcript_23076/g.53974  ORF Transcript_23076/g.53974 Transcript_23076/m.53974 type:complete len:280 (+) Transcript_23076:280-1119(+)
MSSTTASKPVSAHSAAVGERLRPPCISTRRSPMLWRVSDDRVHSAIATSASRAGVRTASSWCKCSARAAVASRTRGWVRKRVEFSGSAEETTVVTSPHAHTASASTGECSSTHTALIRSWPCAGEQCEKGGRRLRRTLAPRRAISSSLEYKTGANPLMLASNSSAPRIERTQDDSWSPSQNPLRSIPFSTVAIVCRAVSPQRNTAKLVECKAASEMHTHLSYNPLVSRAEKTVCGTLRSFKMVTDTTPDTSRPVDSHNMHQVDRISINFSWLATKLIAS